MTAAAGGEAAPVPDGALAAIPAGYRDAEGIAKVVAEGLCHRCGACVGFCPAGTYETDSLARPVAVNPCVHCHICVRVCSGLAVDYPAIGRHVFGPDYAFGAPEANVRAAYIGAAGEPAIRRRGASGGAVTQLLVHWLETGRIKGAILTVEDPADPAKGAGVVARTREEIVRGAQSRYTSAPTLAALREIQGDPGPFALVGLPCQIHALRARQLLDARWSARIPIAIGLLCHYNLPCEASHMAARVLTPRGRRVAHADYRQRDATGWPHNTLELTFDDGSKRRAPFGPAQVFNLLSYVAPLGRCLMCLDATAEFADVAVGDPWIRDDSGKWKYHADEGWSSILVRTAQGEELLREAAGAGRLLLRPIPPREVFEGQAAMIREKRERTSFRIRLRRRLGWPVPRYPMALPPISFAQWVREMAFLSARLLPLFPPLGRLLIRFGFSRAGAGLYAWRLRRRTRAIARARGRAGGAGETGR